MPVHHGLRCHHLLRHVLRALQVLRGRNCQCVLHLPPYLDHPPLTEFRQKLLPRWQPSAPKPASLYPACRPLSRVLVVALRTAARLRARPDRKAERRRDLGARQRILVVRWRMLRVWVLLRLDWRLFLDCSRKLDMRHRPETELDYQRYRWYGQGDS